MTAVPSAALAALLLIASPPAPALADVSALPAATPVQAGQCRQRMGPYATRQRAWERLRKARAEAARFGPAYGVSNGVFPCPYDYFTRGYCFNVFLPC